MALAKAISEFKWRWFLKAVGVIVGSVTLCLFLALSPLDRPLYDFVLFHPTRLAAQFKMPDCLSIPAQEASFQSTNGNKLIGWYFQQPGSKFIVLFSHGNGGNVIHRFDNLEMLIKCRVSIFAYDYEGYGKSAGQPTVDHICDDAVAAYDYVNKTLGYPPERIVLFGESLGTVVTGYLGGQVKSAGIILQSPLYSLGRRGREILPVLSIYPEWLYPKGGLDNAVAFSHPHPPLLMVAGTKDPMLPIAHADDIYTRASEPKTFVRIEGAGHTGDPKLTFAPEYTAAVKVFLAGLDHKTTPSPQPTKLPPPI